MKEVIRVADPRIAALVARQATQSAGSDQLGLERIAALLDKLGRPQDRLPPIFHVAGTNGKGSTIAFLRAALEAAGHRVHAFTSPHLVRYNERIRLAGTLIDDERLARLMGVVLDANETVGASLFEVNTAVAFLAFNEVPADAVLLEVGLGGRLDATNIVEKPLVCGIAGLGLDHQQFLGSTLAEVAAEKAGIAKPGVPLITMDYDHDAYLAIANAVGPIGRIWAPMGMAWDAWTEDGRFVVSDDMGEVTLPLPTLPGSHQWQNAALAVEMLRSQDRLAVPEAALAEAMSKASWPARLQHLESGPLVDLLPAGSELWIDGGHNPSAAQLIAEHAREKWQDGLHLVILFASLTSKDSEGVLQPFRGVADRVLTLPIDGHDCRDPAELAAMATTMGITASAHSDISEALCAIAVPSRVLIFGSLYLAGEALSLNGTLPD